MSFIISTDAGADIDSAYAKEKDVRIVSMKYYLKLAGTKTETEYTFGNDEPGLSIDEFYTQLKEGGQAKTALINTFEHKEYFKLLLNEGKDILHVPLSSGLSGTAECAFSAANELQPLYPDRKIIVIDFLGASMGQALFIDYLVELRNDGKSIEQTAAWGNENKLKFCHYFTVDDLGFLRRGGRVSGIAAFIGSIIKIKPLLHADNNGKLIPLEKSIGRKKALCNMVEKMKLLAISHNQRVFISHSNCLEDAQFVSDKVKEAFGITDIKIGHIGPIIGAHSGPGTVALFFMGKNR